MLWKLLIQCKKKQLLRILKSLSNYENRLTVNMTVKRECTSLCVFTQTVWPATSGPHTLVFVPLCSTFPYLIESTFLCRRSIKMAEWEDVELTFYKNTSKIHPYVEEASLIKLETGRETLVETKL